MTAHAGWEGILAEGETILWQGRPDPSVDLGLPQLAKAGFGLLFAGFALVWMILAAQAGGSFWAFGLIHFGIGVLFVLAALMGDSWRRRHTWYTLTDRRAFIATNMPLRGRQLRDYPITADTLVNYHDGHLPSVSFGFDPLRLKKRTTMREVGFERISDGAEVYKMIQQIRSGA